MYSTVRIFISMYNVHDKSNSNGSIVTHTPVTNVDAF
jgi:hypothetical protein